MAAPIAVAASLDLIGIPWAKAVSAASVPANERNPEELDTIARALCLCPCLLESSHAQRIEFARVVRENTSEDKFFLILKGKFHRIECGGQGEQASELTMLAKDWWGHDALFRSGHLSRYKVVCKKSGSIVLALTSADFRSIRSGSLAVSTGLKLQSLMSVDLIASMGKEYVMKNVLHRFKSVFFDSSTILFRQGDVIQESSPIYILANGQVKVLVDPNFKPVSDDTEEVKMVATTEATGCRVICVLHNGEMLGESRLLMDETALRQGPPPMRNATVTASGHVVLLTMSTDMARECFKGDVLEQLRGLGKARLDMRESSPAWLAGKRGGAADSVGEGDTAQNAQAELEKMLQARQLRIMLDQESTEQQTSDELITPCEAFTNITSAMTHTIADPAVLRPSTAPVKSNLVPTNNRRALPDSKEQDCSMTSLNTLLRLMQQQTSDMQHPACLDRTGEGAVDACEYTSQEQPSILEGDDLVDWPSRLKIARAVAVLLKLSDAAGNYRLPGTLLRGLCTKSGAQPNEELQQCKKLHTKELGASHEAVNTLPSWQYVSQKPTSATVRVDRCGRPRSRETSYHDPRSLAESQDPDRKPDSPGLLQEACSHARDQTSAVKLAFGNQIEEADERSARGKKVTCLRSGRCSLQVKPRKAPSAQLHVHMAHSHSLQRLLHRAEEATSSSTHPADPQAPEPTTSVAVEAGTSTAVGFESNTEVPEATEEPKPCSSSSLHKPIWTTIDLPLPLDTKQMAHARCSLLKRTSSKHVASLLAAAACLPASPVCKGAAELLSTNATTLRHPCSNLQSQEWMKVQEEDEDAELSEVYPRRHRRSNPGQKKSRPPKATLPRVSERTVLDAPALIAAEHDDAQLPEQFSSDARDRQPWIEKEEDAPAVHVATAKAWYRSNSRAEERRLKQQLAVELQHKLSLKGSINSTARRGIPWEMPGCRERAASVLKHHAFKNGRGTVSGVVNSAMEQMGYRGKNIK